MNEQTIALLRDLAGKLGTTVEYLWAVLLRQAFVEAVLGIVWLCVVGVVIAGCAKWAWWASKQGDYSEAKPAAYIVGGVIALFCLITGVFAAEAVAVGFLNPEFFALHEVLRHVGRR